MDCSLLGSSVHGIFQARVLKKIAISFSKYGVREESRFRLLFKDIHYSSNNALKRLFFHCWNVLKVVLILFKFTVSYQTIYSCPYTNGLIIETLQWSFEMGKYEFSKFFIIFQDCFGYFGSLVLIYLFQDKLFFLREKKPAGISIGNALDL